MNEIQIKSNGFTYYFSFDELLNQLDGVILKKVYRNKKEYSPFDPMFDTLIPWAKAEAALMPNGCEASNG